MAVPVRRLLAQAFDILDRFRRPISPGLWKRFARALTTGPGWMPPMLLFAGSGVILMLNVGLGHFDNIAWLKTFNLAVTLSWCAVGLLACLLVAKRSIRNLSRFGPRGFLRPRWWFELGRLTWMAAICSLVMVVFGLLVSEMGIVGGLEWLFGIFLLVMGYSWPAFFVVTTIGYLLAFLRGLPCRGRAADCAGYFYLLAGGVGLATWAAMLWPDDGAAGRVMLAAAMGSIGVSMLLVAFLTSIRRWEQLEKRGEST